MKSFSLILAFILLIIATIIFLTLNVNLINNANSDTNKTNLITTVITLVPQDANKDMVVKEAKNVEEDNNANSNSSEDVNNGENKQSTLTTTVPVTVEKETSSFTSTKTTDAPLSDSNDNSFSSDKNDFTATVFPETLKEQINIFIYQLQDVNFEELLSQNADIVFLSEKTSEEQIKQLQDSNTIVISYLSIGEAEKWRDYWQEEWDTNPPFWVAENQEEDNSLVVKYWEQDWKDLTFLRLEQILEKGFDGVVLDTVSTGYHYWEEQGLDKNYTRTEMVKFVKEISEKLHAKGKYVFVNNGTGIIDYEGYLNAIDGLTSEEAFYYNDEPATWSEWDLKLLDKVISTGKPVLAIDYSTKKDLQCDFIKKAKEHEFVPFVTKKGLDIILKIDCN